MNIFIGIFRREVTDDDLAAFFAENGVAVTEAKVERDEYSGKSRLFGRASATDPSAVAVACDGKLLNGKAVRVKAI